jgi:hypothetical protein
MPLCCETMPPQQEKETKQCEEVFDPRCPSQVKESVNLLLKKWGHVLNAIPPHEFLAKLLHSRGYSAEPVIAVDYKQQRPPSPKQIQDYDNEFISAAKNSHFDKIVDLHSRGRDMNACNKFSESIVHMVCRRANYSVVEFVLKHGGDVTIIDDYGRTPLHDACWRLEPAFDVVTMLLDINPNLLRYSDARGALPLKYVPQDNWVPWCVYLYHQKEKYWPIRSDKHI